MLLLLRHLWLVLRCKRSWRPCRCLWSLHGLGTLESIDLHPRRHVLLHCVRLLHLSWRAGRMSIAAQWQVARGARQERLTSGWRVLRPWRHLRWRPEVVVLLLVVPSPPATIN